ncbi:MAG: hypothetical protein Q7T86_12700 [Hyphomicrobiaceae bacterium]|nr:hypothetical protein [Hyphomicrobiaceae bacterium]
MGSMLKVRLDADEGLKAGTAIQVESRNLSPDTPVCVTISNEEVSTSVELNGEQARQLAMALISACGGGGDAG